MFLNSFCWVFNMLNGGFLTTAFICLFISFILSELFLKLKYPRVIGQILTGIILSFPIFAIFFQSNNLNTLSFMSDLGIIFLMLLTGLSLNLHKIRQAEKDAIIIAISCFIVPFVLGFGVMKLLGYNWIEAIIVGACLSLTAEGTTMEVLYDLKAMNTKLGSVIISTGILDDIFEFFFLTLILSLLTDSHNGPFGFGIMIFAFAIILFILFKALPVLLKVVHKDHVEFSSFSLVILFGLAVSAIAAEFQLSSVLGALIAGVFLNYLDHFKDEHKRHVKQLELITFSLLIPFFFINIGLSFDFMSVLYNLPIVIIILIVAIAGKLLGCFLVTPLTDLTHRQMHVVGWAMNSRGLVELVIANFAFSAGLIPIEIFSALVAIAVITTIMFPIVVDKLTKDRKIWYE